MKNVPKLRFKGFSDEWEENSIGSICKLSSGSTPSKAKKENWNGDYLWVTSGELKRKYLFNTIDKISEVGKKESNLKEYKKGTFIIAIYGLEAQGTRGSATILGRKATISQACMALEPLKDVTSEFLYSWYQKHGEMIGIRYAQGTKQQNLSTDLVGNLEIVLPSLIEQEKIANFLTKVDKLIEKQDEKVSNLEQYKKGMMQKIFSQKIRFEKDDGGEYPEWEECKISDISEVTTGNTPSTKDADNYGNEHMWASPADLGDSKYIYNTKTKLSNKGFEKTRKLQSGSILVTCIGSTIGKIGIASAEMSSNQQINAMYSTVNNNEYIYYYLDYNFKNYLSYISFQAVPIINKSQFENFDIILPCIEEQDKIANFLSKIDYIVEKEKEKLEELRVWKKGLLQQIFI